MSEKATENTVNNDNGHRATVMQNHDATPLGENGP